MYNQGYVGYHPMMFPPQPMQMVPPPIMSPRPQKALTDLPARRAYQWPNTSGKLFKSIHEFDVLKQLGKGGFSEVFRARCRRDGKTYAIKKIDLLRINFDDYHIIKEEIDIHGHVKGPNIVEFVDWFKEGDVIYIVLEFVDGVTLFEYLNRHHPLGETFIKKITRQILEGLDVIHKAGVIHKDLKPENVLLDQNLNAKICDFGWSERLKELNISGTIVYMAPEILKLEPYNEKVDIWTVGILLYELFHNIEPFKGETPQDILRAIMTQSLKFDKHCPKEARDLIKYILNIDKNYRPKIAQILNHPYFKVNEPAPMYQAATTAQPTSSPQVLKPSTDRDAVRTNRENLNASPVKYGQTLTDRPQIYQAQPLQNVNNISSRYPMKEPTYQDSPMVLHSQSSKHIKPYDVYDNAQRPQNTTSMADYTAKKNETPASLAAPVQQTTVHAPLRLTSVGADTEKRSTSYTPLQLNQPYAERTHQREGVSSPIGRITTSFHSGSSPEHKSFSPSSPQVRIVSTQNQFTKTPVTQQVITSERSIQDQPKVLNLQLSPAQHRTTSGPQGVFFPRQAGPIIQPVPTFGPGPTSFTHRASNTYKPVTSYHGSSPRAGGSIGNALTMASTQQPQSGGTSQPSTMQIKSSTPRQ